ncbi:hypothetical protein [Bacillus phage FI_KG-Lek]|nr:hypothetical protein [Bacillus phage FI_KG-Lek]
MIIALIYKEGRKCLAQQTIRNIKNYNHSDR